MVPTHAFHRSAHALAVVAAVDVDVVAAVAVIVVDVDILWLSVLLFHSFYHDLMTCIFKYWLAHGAA